MIDFDEIDNIDVSDTDNVLYELGLIKFKDNDGNITTIKSFKEFDKAMSNPNMTMIFE